ncbi:hypothetical protein NE237_006259 [Protea cynaroides]|uniref:Glutamyl-tRNA(Gln) amidotransferase subunit C, chloroplastic/mitochondrial n=1 Tax=Protea cynaroides TaxID=273540 RepID=A0A9Q0KM98_9MAGN|nr:hypothetical protein NE237_006259 [Protea cynaroides]
MKKSPPFSDLIFKNQAPVTIDYRGKEARFIALFFFTRHRSLLLQLLGPRKVRIQVHLPVYSIVAAIVSTIECLCSFQTTMSSRALFAIRGTSISPLLQQRYPAWSCDSGARNFSTRSSFLPSDVPLLAEKARISLTSKEVEEFAPKIRQVIDWFGQLQVVDLQSIEPALRADTEGGHLRNDAPGSFENREAMLAAVPSYEEPYIKIPRVLHKE